MSTLRKISNQLNNEYLALIITLSKLYIQASNLMTILSIYVPTTLVLDKNVLSSQRQEHLILFKMGQRHKNLRYNH